MFSLSISWAEWARAALDSMLGGYTENLKSKMYISCFFFVKNDSIKMTRESQIGNKLSKTDVTELQGESH